MFHLSNTKTFNQVDETEQQLHSLPMQYTKEAIEFLNYERHAIAVKNGQQELLIEEDMEYQYKEEEAVSTRAYNAVLNLLCLFSRET
ncbi:hypothetical protein INT44_000913 [Umbelopsis vinacea]|uniref:Uncharacterized protein n=1 Tax=Umbelopsis vinacea TaxID=44442 RepID=A0A8H7Q8W2_9FUNG|nr:hypothetical protein INT44_000913 [Umbelopsis vinacea]